MQTPFEGGFAVPGVAVLVAPLGIASAAERCPPVVTYTQASSDGPLVSQHLAWLAEAGRLALQLDSSLFPILLRPPPFHGCPALPN